MGSGGSAEACERFPQAGDAISISVQCSHTGRVVQFSRHRGQRVTTNWTTEHLGEAIEQHTGVHRTCQRLMFAGRQLEAESTIESALGCDASKLPDSVKLSLLVDKGKFPMKLGPFKLCTVSVEDTDFELPEMSQEFRRSGFYWDMPTRSLERHGIQSKLTRITGQASPIYPLTLDEFQREQLNIPADAMEFVWSYSVAGYERLESDAYAMDKWEEAVSSGSAVKEFLSIGGFLYFNSDGLIVGAQTLGRTEEGETGCLSFSEPRRWEPEWTAALVAQGRFQKLNIQSLVGLGAKRYCWLRPHEVIEGPDGKPLPMQPHVPHGGFVYLFHEDPLTADPGELAMDRYFEVTSAPLDAGSPRMGPLASVSPSRRAIMRSFTLVSEASVNEIANAVEDTDPYDELMWKEDPSKSDRPGEGRNEECCCIS